MADIDVERKATPVWPWILGLLALGLLGWLLYTMVGRDDDPAAVVTADTARDTLAGGVAAPPVAGGPAAGGDVLQRYQQECTGAQGDMAAGHDFVARCLRQLADAADTVLSRPGGQAEARGELEEVRRRAQELEQSPAGAAGHATLVSGAFTSVAALLERMGRGGAGNAASGGDRLRAQATAVRPDVPLLEQRAEVHAFFRSAGETLQALLMDPARP